MRPSERALLVASLVALVALGGSGCQSHRAEAALVVHNVEAVIAAPLEQKPGTLAKLSATPCEDPEVCRVKKVCEEAFGPLVESYRLTAEVREAIAKTAGSADASGPIDKAGLAAKLDRAEAAKEEARGAETKCLAVKAELARKHKL